MYYAGGVAPSTKVACGIALAFISRVGNWSSLRFCHDSCTAIFSYHRCHVILLNFWNIDVGLLVPPMGILTLALILLPIVEILSVS